MPDPFADAIPAIAEAAHQQFAGGIPAGLPATARAEAMVANKTGEIQ